MKIEGGIRTATLTPREMEILAHARAGLNREQIAQKLGLSLPTVKSHFANIYRKLDVTNRAGALHFLDTGEREIKPVETSGHRFVPINDYPSIRSSIKMTARPLHPVSASFMPVGFKKEEK